MLKLLLLAPWQLLRHLEHFEPHFLTGVVEKMGWRPEKAVKQHEKID
jgi:hypothetical protein